jgi:hypothetical protein
LCGRQAAPERLLLHVVGARAPAVDLDHRDPFAVCRLERRVPVDRDLLELEPELVPQRPYLCERALAEMAALRVVDDDLWSTDTGPV